MGVCDCTKWCCYHKSLFCCPIPRELYSVEFPWYRQVFLLLAAAIYVGDVGLDVFVAYEHHKHYVDGDEDSKWYFILTMLFVILPSVVMNFASWGLYVWCYVVNVWHPCRKFIRRKSRRLRRKFDYALMCVNYAGTYSPSGMEAFQKRQQQQWSRQAMPPNTFTPLDNLDTDLQHIANRVVDEPSNETTDGQNQLKDLSILQGDEVDGNIEFRPIDDLNLVTLLLVTTLHVFQLGLLVRMLRIIYLSSKNKYSYYRYYDLSFLRLIESFMESAPQLILQLYIYIVNPESDLVYRIVTPISMLFSLVSLALAITDYHSAGKDALHYMSNGCSRDRLSWTAYFVIIFWQLCLIVSRALAFSFFATEFGLYLFVFLLAHFLLMAIWIYSQGYKMCICKAVRDQTDSKKKSNVYNYHLWFCPCIYLTRNCCLELVIASFNTFFFFNFTMHKSKVTWILYYSLQAIENFALIILFFAFTDSQVKWNSITGLISTVVSFFLGVGFMVLYYRYFHPAYSSCSEDQVDSEMQSFQDKLTSELYGKIQLTFTLNWLIIENGNL